MKPVKFIIFADAEKDCETRGDNFLKQDLKLDYWVNGNECAIGLKVSKAERITEYSETFDVYLFNDISRRPESDSVFFERFCSKFFQSQSKFDYKIILHSGSGWDFNSIKPNEVDEDGEQSDYVQFAQEISWLQSLKEHEDWKFQSHNSNDVYGKELKDIAKAIDDGNNIAYGKALRSLNGIFMDKQLEDFHKPFATSSPYETTNKQGKILKDAKTELQTYVGEYLKKQSKP